MAPPGGRRLEDEKSRKSGRGKLQAGEGASSSIGPTGATRPGGCWGMPGYQGSDLWRAWGPWESPRAPKFRGKRKFLFFAGFGLIKKKKYINT